MARSVPPEPVWPPDTAPAERALWSWAVEQLDDDVLALPGVRLTDVRAGQRDAELDLVLVDPAWGVLVVEVKGGTLTYDAQHGRWWRDLGGGRRKEVRDPVAQAQRGTSFVKGALASHRVGDASVPVGWAVAVPDCRLEAPGGAYLPTGKLWDALAKDQLARRYAAATHAPGPGEQPPGPALAQRIADLLRGRAREGRRSLAASVAAHEQFVLAHTESHRDALYAFAHHRRVLVQGAAGTGKTALALQSAATQAAAGDRVLLGCWNAVLGRWLRTALRRRLTDMGSPLADEVTDDLRGRIVVGNVAGLVGNAHPEPFGADLASEEVFHQRMPGWLDEEATGGPFDTIVLDEAQDLTDLWIYALAGLLADRSRLHAFAHTEQDLFGARAPLEELVDATHQLRESFRSTRQISQAAEDFLEVLHGQAEPVECIAGEGADVAYVAAPAEHVPARAREHAKRLFKDDRFSPGEVAVLALFANRHKGDAAAVAESEEAGELIETNCATFKGLERPVVFLALDLHPDKAARAGDAARAAYVGATRARALLTIVGDPDIVDAYGFTRVAGKLRTSKADQEG